MNQPSAPQLPPDPNLAIEQQTAQNDLVANLQKESQSDMASLMARYGTRLAMAGTTVSPITGGVNPAQMPGKA